MTIIIKIITEVQLEQVKHFDRCLIGIKDKDTGADKKPRLPAKIDPGLYN